MNQREQFEETMQYPLWMYRRTLGKYDCYQTEMSWQSWQAAQAAAVPEPTPQEPAGKWFLWMLARAGWHADYPCEDCIGMKDHGCYCKAMNAIQPGGPAA